MQIRPRAPGAAALLLIATGLAMGQPYGIDSRPANTSLRITSLPADTPGTLQTQRVFPDLTFTQPLFITESPDSSQRLFVVEKTGRIKTFSRATPNPPVDSVVTFLDLSSRVVTNSEQGLLGLAFDPDFAVNGRFYVHYNVPSPRRSVISRLTCSPPSAAQADPASEEVLLTVSQPFENHKGGMIAFGPDNMLYIALGDGGSAGDPNNHAQNTASLLGKILRIDVRSTPPPGQTYAIPPDNPFADGNGPAGASTRQEIWAYGLRNPWRFSFDRLNGTLFCADVGQGRFEEVNVITRGGNYGWRRKEGFECYNPSSNCEVPGLIDPVTVYDHSQGLSITGGYVYHGSTVPGLYGMYIYGDYVSGRIWGFRWNGSEATHQTVLDSGSGRAISSFGQDQDGEVYITDLSNGGIYVLRPATPPSGTPFPARLSDMPALLAAGLGQDQTAQGILPYEPSAKLWSDGAAKERFIALPNLDQAGFRLSGGWDFGEEALLIKNFILPLDERAPAASARRVETRLLYRKNGQWNGFSYRWNEEGTDAELLTSGSLRTFVVTDSTGATSTYTWQFPSRSQCLQCHTSASNGVLGLNTAQMNFDFHYPASGVTDNQLRTLDHIGFFTESLPAPPETLPRMPDPSDTSATTESRARAYLAANCAMCHQPGGTAPTSIDLRWETPTASTLIVGSVPTAGDLGIPGARIIAPGDPDRSVLLQRMAQRGTPHQMPPLATSRVDGEAVALIRAWIAEMPPPAGIRSSKWTLYE